MAPSRSSSRQLRNPSRADAIAFADFNPAEAAAATHTVLTRSAGAGAGLPRLQIVEGRGHPAPLQSPEAVVAALDYQAGNDG